jgi:hypothetical protein
MVLKMDTVEPTLEPVRPVMDTTPMVNTMLPFPMVVSRLSPTLLMAMAILLMSSTLESLFMLLPQLMPQLQLLMPQPQLLLLLQLLMPQHPSTDLPLHLTGLLLIAQLLMELPSLPK